MYMKDFGDFSLLLHFTEIRFVSWNDDENNVVEIIVII